MILTHRCDRLPQPGCCVSSSSKLSGSRRLTPCGGLCIEHHAPVEASLQITSAMRGPLHCSSLQCFTRHASQQKRANLFRCSNGVKQTAHARTLGGSPARRNDRADRKFPDARHHHWSSRSARSTRVTLLAMRRRRARRVGPICGSKREGSGAGAPSGVWVMVLLPLHGAALGESDVRSRGAGRLHLEDAS